MLRWELACQSAEARNITGIGIDVVELSLRRLFWVLVNAVTGQVLGAKLPVRRLEGVDSFFSTQNSEDQAIQRLALYINCVNDCDCGA